MATLKDLRDQVQTDANILGDSVNFPDGRVDHFINQASRYVQAELNGLGMKKWEKKSSLSLTLAQDYVGISTNQMDIPTDMLESPKSIIQLELNDGTTSGVGREVNQSKFSVLCGNKFHAPTVKQPIFMRLNNKIYIAPDDANDGSIHYYKVVAELTADADVSEIPSEFIEYVVRRAVSQIEKTQGKLSEAVAKEKDISNDIASAFEKFTSKMNTEKATEILN